MNYKKTQFYIFFLFSLLLYFPCHADIIARGKDAFIRVRSGGNFVVDQAISNYGCSLFRDTSGTISGQEITFQDGIFEDAGNELRLSAIFNPSGTLTLNGSDRIRAYGGEVLQSIVVSGFNNSIEGVPRLTDSITLQDMNTTLSLAIQNDIDQNIVLNNGAVILEDNLSFGNDSILTTDGTIDGNGFILETGAKNFTWSSNILWKDNSHLSLRACKTDLTGTFTFQGETSINGQGNVFDLLSNGQLVVAANSTLFLSDLVLKGLGNDAGRLILAADSSVIKMSNVDLEFISTLTMTQGGIYIKGPVTAILKDNNWVFDSSSSMTVDGMSLYIDPAGSNVIGDIVFADEAVQLDLLNTGTIKLTTLAVAGGLPSRVERLESCCDVNGSMIDMLKISTGFLQSQIDAIEEVTSVSTIVSLIDRIESKVDSNTTMIDMLKISTGELQNQIDILGTSTQFLQMQVDQTQMFTYQVILYGTQGEIPPFAVFCAGFKLNDSTVTTTFEISSPVKGDIDLNGGTLILQKDLILQNNSFFTGSGTVLGNNQKLDLAESTTVMQDSVVFDDVTLVINNDIAITSTLTFKNSSTFDAQGHAVDVATGCIVADPNATLHVHRALLANVVDNHVACVDDTGTIILDDVLWSQGGNSEFAQGALEIRGNTTIACFRGSIFSYRTTQTCTITTESSLTLDDRLTFSYDPVNGDSHLIELASPTAALQLAGSALLHVTLGGLHLRRGNLFVLSNSRIASEIQEVVDVNGNINVTDNGITLGSRNSEEDIRIVFDANAQLNLLTGSINYKNILANSWEMLDDRSRLRLSENTVLRLFESMNLDAGNIVSENAVKIAFASGRTLTGAVNPFGALFKTIIIEI
jgi:hypothetical protein